MTRSQMLRLSCCAFLATMLFAISGCEGPAKPPVQPEAKPAVKPHAVPVNLRLTSGDGRMTVAWQVKGDDVLSGYNIYVQPESPDPKGSGHPNLDIKPINGDVYPGDNNPDDNMITYEVERIENGQYFVWVRLVRPDGSLSDPTAIESTVCGPRGEIILGVRYQSTDDGYSLAEKKKTRADASDNDLYYYTKDGVDYLASPSRLNSYLRATSFKPLPFRGELESVRNSAMTLSSVPTDDKIAVKSGDWIWAIVTPSQYALIHILSVDGKDKDRQIKCYYSLSPVKGIFPY
jgi:hypothetical protein